MQGWQWRDRRIREHHAWMVAYLLQPYRGKGDPPLQPADLLKPPAEDDGLTMPERLALAMQKQAARRARQED